jgi:hypothetical protein
MDNDDKVFFIRIDSWCIVGNTIKLISIPPLIFDAPFSFVYPVPLMIC